MADSAKRLGSTGCVACLCAVKPDTERLGAGEQVRQWEPFRRQAEKRLCILESATLLGDLSALNSNRLEGLKGNRKRQYSIRINDQWRICFQWLTDEQGPSNVAIVDYH